jgi:hypothetical protein
MGTILEPFQVLENVISFEMATLLDSSLSLQIHLIIIINIEFLI